MCCWCSFSEQIFCSCLAVCTRIIVVNILMLKSCLLFSHYICWLQHVGLYICKQPQSCCLVQKAKFTSNMVQVVKHDTLIHFWSGSLGYKVDGISFWLLLDLNNANYCRIGTGLQLKCIDKPWLADNHFLTLKAVCMCDCDCYRWRLGSICVKSSLVKALPKYRGHICIIRMLLKPHIRILLILLQP